MEKKTVWWIVVLVLVIGYFSYVFLSYKITGCNNSMSYEEMQGCCLKWAEKNNLPTIIECRGYHWVFENEKCELVCGEQLIGGCGGVALEHQQECCGRWAAENQIITPACVGEWVVQDGQCGWMCG